MKDHLYMQRALELAEMGRGNVSPNPMVGCVIVHKDIIIGEGYHEEYGKAHAEVNAINSVIEKSLLKSATAYVTLEPCSHFGKTPPCADLLIKHQIKKVIICNKDPYLEVNGKGIAKLQSAGIEVEVGLLAEKGLELNKRFFKNAIKKEAFIILKWAESQNACVSTINSEPVAISGAMAMMYNHKWRTEEDAYMVGTSTALNDNPSLTARHWPGKNPVRIVIDFEGQIRVDAHIFDDQAKTIVFGKKREIPNVQFIEANKSLSFFKNLPTTLHNLGIHSLVVEGGPELHNLFIVAGVYDEIRIIKSKKLVLTNGLAAATLPSKIILNNTIDLLEDYLHFYSVPIPTI